MKRIFVIVSLLTSITVNNSLAQKSGWNYHFSGFVDPQLFFDTRKVVSGREGQMLFYPAPQLLDADGNDLNAIPSLNMLAITTRLGLRINAPDLGETHVSGYVEGDFTGSTESGINMLRLRHAYLEMKRNKSSLLLGQYWHPLVVHELMPGTRPLNMGVPFHPYSRYVQARYTYTSDSWLFAAVAAFQLDNASDGPAGKSSLYLRNSCYPELNLQMRYLWKSGQIGLMVQEEIIKPRDYATDPVTLARYKTGTLLPSTSFSLFFGQKIGNYKLNFQALYGDNLYEQALLGGYVEMPFDTVTHSHSYEALGCFTTWADFRRSNGKWRPGIFGGYGYNVDFGKNLKNGSVVYGRGFDIYYLWRVQPQIGFYPTDWLNFFAEIEYTAARYGEKLSNSSEFYYRSSYMVSNTRFILSAVLNF